MRKLLQGMLLVAAVVAGGAQAAVEPKAVVKTYSDIAAAGYQDALTSAKTLQQAIGALIAQPSEATLKAAREAWIVARAPYQQTEVFRFGNPVVDDWEGRVNAWPLDEGLIDYVDAGYGTESDDNAFYAVNVIANSKISVGGKTIDAGKLTPELLAEVLHEADGNEANVATGYHAIEFLLWGQDLNGTGPAPKDRKGTPQERHAGNRPHTDFDPKHCTGGNCERRVAYLKVVTQLLVDDLKEMAGQWQDDGDARKVVQEDPKAGLVAMLTGMGSLSYGELAGERMKLGLMLHDPEEEHDCFSDNTHNSHYYNQIGIRNVYLGAYTRPDGKQVSGASLSDLVKEKDPKLDTEVRAKLNATVAAMQAMRDRAEKVETYDQMIAEGNKEGNAIVQAAIDRLIDQTRSFERVIALLDLSDVTIEGSDSLDKPVFK
ncbi:imelysin family protein [Bordetella avium]|uniref:imelysin family protein n=1 Tax=Bordetella avium TaxID=521 RepID=UPI000E0BC433|nr:imelysin family protein [Bordetella avium]RIQ13110.1 peptidase [Bordetella avium]RIQ54031.1 peptidase [Bordetella avium]RIQ62431.1 peptidase [Bordetella avium]RIQ63554.1 peptidase [Bordetella avium]RIQ78799.1 peptidase [Bordetella avium]